MFAHWLFDFVCQTHNQAVNKSSSNTALILHTASYSLLWAIGFVVMMFLGSFTGYEDQTNVIKFIVITFVCHTVTDYYTSRANSLMYKKGDMHNFFVGIGWDQFVHYFQLFLTYHYLFLK